ncbi:hypothetical protein D918_01046 [Trichuris suis]|nr:hypothetical protein D918_01046 [Trichuris suis]
MTKTIIPCHRTSYYAFYSLQKSISVSKCALVQFVRLAAFFVPFSKKGAPCCAGALAVHRLLTRAIVMAVDKVSTDALCSVELCGTQCSINPEKEGICWFDYISILKFNDCFRKNYTTVNSVLTSKVLHYCIDIVGAN